MDLINKVTFNVCFKLRPSAEMVEISSICNDDFYLRPVLGSVRRRTNHFLPAPLELSVLTALQYRDL